MCIQYFNRIPRDVFRTIYFLGDQFKIQALKIRINSFNRSYLFQGLDSTGKEIWTETRHRNFMLVWPSTDIRQPPEWFLMINPK